VRRQGADGGKSEKTTVSAIFFCSTGYDPIMLASIAMVLCCAGGDGPLSMAEQARRLIAERCLRCHGGVRERAQLNLHGSEHASRPAASGLRAIVPGDPASSELLRRISASDPDERMPLDGPALSAAEQELLTAWIAAGAPESPHWSFVAPVVPTPPSEAKDPWCRQPIDGFILRGLHQAELEPSPEADRATLLRRASLDLIGLPPTEAELAAFMADESPDAFDRVVDRLLSSPHYGERWAAPWLDIARYADTQGYEKDGNRTIWAWRDWVIDALNANMPFDQFTREQLAGDLLPDANERMRVATAFHRNTLNNAEGGTDNEEFRIAAVMDRVATTWNAWMGLSMQCVQCHSHPHDDLTHADYYRFMDFLNQQADADTDDDAPTMPITTAHGATQVPVLQELPDAARRTTHRLDRGALTSPAEAVQAGTPASLHAFGSTWPRDRRGMVEWIVAPTNPLTARVIVNRAWESIFGTGLVATSSDFGVMGDAPSNPALLDDMAIRFRDGGWDIKRLMRELVLSSTYRQAAVRVGAGVERDPSNRLLWHAPRRRLDAETIRDSALLVSGLLSRTMGGPPVMPPQPDGIWNIVYNGAKWTNSEGENRHRRAIYTFWRRSAPYPSLMTLDAVDRATCTVRRVRTNTPLAALVTLNDPAFVECAVALARSVDELEPTTAINTMWHRALLRAPVETEHAVLRSLFDAERARYESAPADAAAVAGEGEKAVRRAAMTSVASAILNTDEFLSRP